MSLWSASRPAAASCEEQKRVALGYITEAWIEAVKDGLDPDMVAEAALEAAVKELVALKGEASVGALLSELAPRAERGEFTVYLSRQ
jgi:hypothetical protein